MTTPKISKEVSDLLDPDWAKSDAGGPLVPVTPRKPDPAKTQKELDRLLCPDDLRDKPDDPDLKPDPTGLVPDWAREKKGEDEEDELQTKNETPKDEKESAKVEISFSGLTLGEWAAREAQRKEEAAEKESKAAEKEKLAIERENEEIKESFRRVTAKMKGDDLTPDELK